MDEDSTTELDYHAYMVGVGQYTTIINQLGQHAKVQKFCNEYNTLEEVPIVDAMFVYGRPYILKIYLLIVRNMLHIPSTQHNLIPLFIMCEAGKVANDVPIIHCGEEVTCESHSIAFEDPALMIPLKLKGIFSAFATRN